MRKKSKYRPKRNLLNPVGFVLEGLTPVRAHSAFMLDLKLKNHGALAALMQGKGARYEVEVLINMLNVSEALTRLDAGAEYADMLRDAQTALLSLGRRAAQTGKFIMNASEIKQLNDAMELHDAQMDVITLQDMEKALALVKKDYDQKKVVLIVQSD